MAANVNSSEFTHATQLFADKSAANAWRTSMTVFDATTANEGVVKQCTHVGDITTIDGDPVTTGASASDQTSIGAKDLSTDVGTRQALIILAEKINYLTYRMEQAGLMASS
jgi:hypothetical protein